MIQNPKAIKEILDKFNSKKKKVLRGKLTKTDQNSNKPSQKINDKLGKKNICISYHRLRPAISDM